MSLRIITNSYIGAVSQKKQTLLSKFEFVLLPTDYERVLKQLPANSVPKQVQAMIREKL